MQTMISPFNKFMTYKLLKFNEDYADEHNVPALACMTNDDYIKWLMTPSGIPNENYEQELIEYNNKVDLYKQSLQKWRDRGVYYKNFDDFTLEDRQYIKENPLEYISERDRPKKCKSYLQVYLGNGGDYFKESYEHLYLMSEFVEHGVVKVMNVSEEFFNTFQKARLSDLSLCNIFAINNQEFED